MATHDGRGDWKVPAWQAPVRTPQLALHPDGPLVLARRESYLQKRAGARSIRWNVRYFELKEGHLRWWRPAFKEQCLQRSAPKAVAQEPRPVPNRCLDLRHLTSISRTRVKFPYSTRIMLQFGEAHKNYKLELRAEKELEIIEWYRVLSRFTMETIELETDETDEPGTSVVEDESSDEDASPPARDP